MAECQSCGAEIVWFKTRAGKWMPADPRPEKRLVVRASELVEVKDTYVPHWATCPDAEDFRA